MPFGLSGASTTFQRMMDGVLMGWMHSQLTTLMILSFLRGSLEELLGHVRDVLHHLKESN